jgi:hypothetical protein
MIPDPAACTAANSNIKREEAPVTACLEDWIVFHTRNDGILVNAFRVCMRTQKTPELSPQEPALSLSNGDV